MMIDLLNKIIIFLVPKFYIIILDTKEMTLLKNKSIFLQNKEKCFLKINKLFISIDKILQLLKLYFNLQKTKK